MFKAVIKFQEIEPLERGSFDGRIDVVDSLGPLFDEAVAYLKSQKVIGFDTESRPVFTHDRPSYGTALLQLAGPDRAFLFRTKYIGVPPALRSILADPEILKIGAAIQDDNIGLQKYGDFVPAGFVDLQKIVGQWGIYDKSVKKMAAIILGVRISKSQQLSNWEAEYLSPAQKQYAATDAWICLMMYQKLVSTEKHPLSPEQISELSGIPLERVLHPRVKRSPAPQAPPKYPPGTSKSAKRRARRKMKKLKSTAANDKSDIEKG